MTTAVATTTAPTAAPFTKPSFTDALGRVWVLNEIGIGDLDDLTAAGLDIEKAGEDLSLLAELASKPRAFAKVLWWFVGDAVERAGVTVQDFNKALKGDALSQAFVAIRNAVVLFTPWPRATKERMIQKLNEAAERVGTTPRPPDGSEVGSSTLPPSAESTTTG